MSTAPIMSTDYTTAEGLENPIPLGGQGLMSSRIGFGAMSIGINMNGKDLYGKKALDSRGVAELIKCCQQSGATHIDTAQLYKSAILLVAPCCSCCCCKGSYSESKLSGPIQDLGRDNFQVATKVDPAPKKFGSKKNVKATCLESLERLGLESIDLYYMHRIDQTVPIEEGMEAMNELKAEGKIKHVGLSECSAATLRRAHAVCPISCIQMEWSLFARDLETSDIIATCTELGVGIVCYSPLGRGMLTNTVDVKKLAGTDFRKMGKVGYVQHPRNAQSLKDFQAVADRLEVKASTLALAWLIKYGNSINPAGVVPIPGTSNPAHVVENCKAAGLADRLTDEDMAEIETAVPKEIYQTTTRYSGDQASHLWSNDKNPMPK